MHANFSSLTTRRGAASPAPGPAAVLLDHRVGYGDHVGWNIEADGLGGPEIDDEKVFDRQFDRQVARLGTAQDAVRQATDANFLFHKLATYYHGWRQRRHVEQFGVEQLRVLTVTTSEKRIETMLDAQREVTNGKGSDLFLFIDEAKLESTDPLEAEWVTGKGNRVRLTD